MCSEVCSLHCQFKLVHFCKLGVQLLGPLFHGTRTLRNVQQEIKQFSPHLNAKIIHPAVHRCVCTKYKEWQFTSKLTPPPVTDGCWKLDKPELRTLTCSHYPSPPPSATESGDEGLARNYRPHQPCITHLPSFSPRLMLPGCGLTDGYVIRSHELVI